MKRVSSPKPGSPRLSENEKPTTAERRQRINSINSPMKRKPRRPRLNGKGAIIGAKNINGKSRV